MKQQKYPYEQHAEPAPQISFSHIACFQKSLLFEMRKISLEEARHTLGMRGSFISLVLEVHSCSLYFFHFLYKEHFLIDSQIDLQTEVDNPFWLFSRSLTKHGS